MLQATTLAALAAALVPSVMGQNFFVMYTPGGDDTAVERIDPIISPGGISQHVHQLFGANALANTLSYDSLQQSDCTTAGDSAGNLNTEDKSIYWHPALFMESSGGSGYVRVPTNGHKIYYIDAGEGEAVEPFEFPQGFRMIAGDPFSRVADTTGALTWSCYNGGENTGSGGGFPTGVSQCSSYPYFNGMIEFPHCWNGDAYDPTNPSAHMAYPEGGDPRAGSCPSSHPKRVPHLFLENLFDIDSVSSKVKADSFVLAQGDNTGFGWHADFFNGWNEGALSALLSNCQSEDIGSCSNFKGGAATTSCSLPVEYKENVDTPSPYLPGCNPISDTNPAPMYQIAALGTNTNKCQVSSGGGPASNSSSSAPAYSSSTGSAQASSPAESGGASSYSTGTLAGTGTLAASTFATLTTTYAAGTSPSVGATKKHGHKHKHTSYGYPPRAAQTWGAN